VVDDYRAAHAIAARNDRSEASTEDLRQALVHYRSLFEELLEDRPAEDPVAEDPVAEDRPAEDRPAEDRPAEDRPAEERHPDRSTTEEAR
jgi:hypothetical protein